MAEIFQFAKGYSDGSRKPWSIHSQVPRSTDCIRIRTQLGCSCAINITVFAKLGVATRKPKPQEMQDPEFIDFAKAYFRYQQGHHPTGTKNESKALRAVEASSLQVNGSANIDGLSITVSWMKQLNWQGSTTQMAQHIVAAVRLSGWLSL